MVADRLVVDTAALRSTAAGLDVLAGALVGHDGAQLALAGRSGHPHLERVLSTFVEDSAVNRRRLAEDVRTVAAWTERVATALEHDEDELSAALSAPPAAGSPR